MRYFVWNWAVIAGIGLASAAVLGGWFAVAFVVFRLITGYPA